MVVVFSHPMNLGRGISDSQEHPDTLQLFFSTLLVQKSLSPKPWKKSPAAFNTASQQQLLISTPLLRIGGCLCALLGFFSRLIAKG